MGRLSFFLVSVLIALPLFCGLSALAAGTEDGSEQWGYVEVRPKAHLFWWLYKSPYRVEDPSKPWPVILWLQGGPGGSGVGIGNFLEIGPLDGDLKPRNSTWLRKADLLFVDSPVGTGYSYVDDVKDDSLPIKTDDEAAIDLTTLLKKLFNGNMSLQQSPLFVVAESYGGKFAVTVGLSILKAVEAGELNLKLGGVALGNSWISSEDFVLSWGPLLKAVSRVDSNGLNDSNSLAQTIKQQLAKGQYLEAEQSWEELENMIGASSNDVASDFYNILLDHRNDPIISSTSSVASKATSVQRYSKHLYSFRPTGAEDDVSILLNGAIREKLKIIPNNITWGGQENIVFPAMIGDFMKPRIQEVDELLAKGINVTVYNGQVGRTEDVLSSDRYPLYCDGDESVTKAFKKSYKNLHFYWILGAGHFVPVDQPCISLEMIGNITQSPNIS
ncbi:hypothetical protein IFM89_036375 [Coptis chinensis]|uniref:Carboxypeptidase n=1 Tax=Coptis chinensis TaxID=261450 RepID=A0A835HB38_9MAGN|nr:hypothetical protein IFM89_036375 [Coptis chinensis]